MKRILVTGGNGMLAQTIKIYSEQVSNCMFIFKNSLELDITDSLIVDNFLKNSEIDLVINCAAYTKVDLAENNQEKCLLVNQFGAKNLAIACSNHKVKLVHISTDYVFGGDSFIPYTEDDVTKPINFYSLSKLNGEEEVNKYNRDNSLIIRTSWLYSKHFGSNFYKTMFNLTKSKSELKVVYDQVGTPTLVDDLAKILIKISQEMDSIDFRCQKYSNNIFHFSNEGVCSWYDFAYTINKSLQNNCIIIPIESKDFPTIAKRPNYSVLNKSKIKQFLNIEIAHWSQHL
jgi:dTDP-4-dehydrorhamnose reductase